MWKFFGYICDKYVFIYIVAYRYLQKFRVSKAVFKFVLQAIGPSDALRMTYMRLMIRLAMTLQLLGSGVLNMQTHT